MEPNLDQEQKNENHENHEKEMNLSFENETKKWKKIREAGGMKEFFKGLPEEVREKAFAHPEGMVVVCIDEGCTCNAHIGNEPELNLAGSGILYDIDTTVEMLKDKDIAVITSHDGCGAAALAGKNPYEYTAETVRRINDYRAEKGLPLVKHEHISAQAMTRHEAFHEATAVYFNMDTKLFDATKVVDENGNEIMTKGFTIDAGHFSLENSLAELGVSVDIAFGNHGFGERFSEENPFVIVFVGDNSEMEKEATKLIEEREEFKKGLIKIDYLN